MSDIAIRVENVSKKYRLGERGGYRTIRESLSKLSSLPARWFKRGNNANHGPTDVSRSATARTTALADVPGNTSDADLLPSNETDGDTLTSSVAVPGPVHSDDPSDPNTFWVLRDVSFEVKRGEVLGIIGRNGAGKSTLLKILSRITEPTTGRIDLYGRVASLLEVGTGFHPELTGRENIYLNGAILGMTRAEINHQFDAIIDFAGVEKFLDTPVKRYSSGMRVRLGFAVAAHLDPEILIIDEVLAVGDAEFQKKCLGKMNEVADSGRTVLFVSHNMAAVERLCHRCLLLDAGKASNLGKSDEIIRAYLREAYAGRLCWRRPTGYTDEPFIESVTVCDENRNPVDHVTTDSTVGLQISCRTPSDHSSLKLALLVADAHGQPLVSTNPSDAGIGFPTNAGQYSYFVCFPPSLFMPQRYLLTVSLYEFGRAIDVREACIVIDVIEVASLANSGFERRPGVFQLKCCWNQEFEPST